MIYIALIVGCGLLYKGGDWLLDGMLGIGQKFGWPKAIIGLVLVSLGTSAPELFVSIGATLQGHGGLAAGNVIGSNIINIAVVLGIAASVVALPIEKVFKNQLITVTVISFYAVWVISDSHVIRSEGLTLIVLMGISFLLAFRHHAKDKSTEQEQPASADQSVKKLALITIAGIVALLVGAESLIWGGLALAEQLGLPETVVALTVTALGTSLPEIAATIVAVTRRETSLALGNVIGSNLLNLGLVLGLSALIKPLLQINLTASTQAYFAGLIFFIFALSIKPGHLPKWAGYGLLLSYVIYVVALLGA